MTCTNDRYGPVCERLDVHDGSIVPHRAGTLIWHDPPRIYVDGEPYVASSEPFVLFGKVVE